MEKHFVELTVANGIATVTMNRPDRLNALHPPAHYELDDIFRALAADDALRVVVLTGAGDRAFCAGYDLQHNLDTGVLDIPETGFGGLTRRTGFPHPLIAAVNGVALGGGFEMALACDLIIADPHARFALPEPKVGWVALSGGVQRLPRAIGTKRALGMILTGRMVSAVEGEKLGFVNEVTEPGAALSRALAWAEEIAACAPLAVRCSRAAAYASLDMDSLDMALDVRNFPQAAVVLASEDAAEGKRAFAQRRAPRFLGR
ncbi:MAG TPA: enoyl-CoA hydratase-related protein [Acetobacteraceae bacterium]|nr:enoyl-CoA hydratase-related protein [Acetobacteraceae bacterium]